MTDRPEIEDGPPCPRDCPYKRIECVDYLIGELEGAYWDDWYERLQREIRGV